MFSSLYALKKRFVAIKNAVLQNAVHTCEHFLISNFDDEKKERTIRLSLTYVQLIETLFYVKTTAYNAYYKKEIRTKHWCNSL